MAVRALIVAIENYPAVNVGGIAKQLPGTLQAGLDFRKWLVDKWAAEGRDTSETQILLCSEPVQPDGAGAARKDILRALLRLKQDGQNATDELYVFFSGHGFSFLQKPGSRADVVLSADFESGELSADCCLNLDEIVSWLRDHLGPGRHFYFVDACRNPLDASQIQVGPLLPIDPNSSAEASTFVLQSTVDGATAAVGGRFPSTLMAGLRGQGRAKAWDDARPDAMFVRYDSLRQFVKTTLANSQAVSSRVEGPDGEGDVVLATLSPIPLSRCTVKIANSSAGDPGELFLKRRRSTSEERKPLGGEPFEIQVEPDTYTVAVRFGTGSAKPSDPVAVDLFDDRTVEFTRIDAAPAAPEVPPSPPMAVTRGERPPRPGRRGLGERPHLSLAPTPKIMEAADTVETKLVVPPNAKLDLKDLATGKVLSFGASDTVSLEAGPYLATLSGEDGRVFKRREIDCSAGGDLSVDLTDWRSSVPRVSIAERLPEQGGAVDFSESLDGAVTDSDLNLWLALLGGGRLLGSRGDYSKLGGFPLRDFAGQPPGSSPIYVLAGFENPDTKLRVGTSKDADVHWSDASTPPDMPGIFEGYLPAAPGPLLVSLEIDGQPPYTVASLASPNRGMLLTLTLDDEGDPRIGQYLLPMGHLLPEFPDEVRSRIESRTQLRDIRFLARAYRAFRKRRALTNEVSSDDLEALLYAKWIDPIASSLAAYELLRRGRKSDLSEVVFNMRNYFPDLPDTYAIAKLYGEPIDRPPGVPLFFDGLRAFPDYADWLPLPAGHLDFTSPWTAWRAAVGP